MFDGSGQFRMKNQQRESLQPQQQAT